MTAQVHIQLTGVKDVLTVLAALGESVGNNRYKVKVLRTGEPANARWRLVSVMTPTW